MRCRYDSRNSEVIFDLAQKRKERTELEETTLAPDFWSNPQKVQKVNQRLAALRDEIGEYDALTLTLEELLILIELATEGSAKAIGLERVGRLEPGWHADLTLTDLNPKDQNNGAGTGLPTPVTEHNLADQLVLWRNGTDVRRTMAAGKWIYAKDSSSEVSTVDLEQLRHQVQSQATRLWR